MTHDFATKILSSALSYMYCVYVHTVMHLKDNSPPAITYFCLLQCYFGAERPFHTVLSLWTLLC